mgnify:CR=1 FL=1|tara:strand:+ start:43 stop:357 length:315 start_codon:yes stop_codon:yes gene_type:complete
MKTLMEKEEKLNLALQKLKNLKLKNPKVKELTENLFNQKNQLEIEKQEIEEKYKLLQDDYGKLKIRIKEQNQSQRKKELQFNEKIDELNQETDNLLEEIDKWEM